MLRILVLLLGATLVPGAQPQSKLDAGQVILLAARPPAEVSPLLEPAIDDADPLVRSAAARVIAANDDRRLGPKLSLALAAEREEVVGAEQVRALLMLHGEAALQTVDPHVQRLGGLTALPLLEWLARHQPHRLAERLPQLASAAPQSAMHLLGPLVAYAARHRESSAGLLDAWMAVAPQNHWRRTLSDVLLAADDLRAAAPLVVKALASPRPHIRDETVWYLVFALGRGLELPSDVLSAAGPSSSEAMTWEAFGRELIARRAAKATAVDRSTFLKAQSNLHRLRGADTIGLSKEEAAIVRKTRRASSDEKL